MFLQLCISAVIHVSVNYTALKFLEAAHTRYDMVIKNFEGTIQSL